MVNETEPRISPPCFSLTDIRLRQTSRRVLLLSFPCRRQSLAAAAARDIVVSTRNLATDGDFSVNEILPPSLFRHTTTRAMYKAQCRNDPSPYASNLPQLSREYSLAGGRCARCDCPDVRSACKRNTVSTAKARPEAARAEYLRSEDRKGGLDVARADIHDRIENAISDVLRTHNQTVLVNRLPREIICHVFSFLPFEDRHQATCVCSHWRLTAFADPCLWTDLDLELIHDFGRATEILGLSRELPLNLRVALTDFDGPTSWGYSVLDFLRSEGHRIRQLALIVNRDARGLIQNIVISGTHLEELQVSVRFGDDSESPLRVIFVMADGVVAESAPKLSKLRLRNTLLSQSAMFFTHLRWLQISLNIGITSDLLISILAPCLHLEHFAISGISFSQTDTNPPAPVLETSLRHLELVTKGATSSLLPYTGISSSFSSLPGKVNTATIPSIIIASGTDIDVLNILVLMAEIHTIISSAGEEVQATDSRGFSRHLALASDYLTFPRWYSRLFDDVQTRDQIFSNLVRLQLNIKDVPMSPRLATCYQTIGALGSIVRYEEGNSSCDGVVELTLPRLRWFTLVGSGQEFFTFNDEVTNFYSSHIEMLRWPWVRMRCDALEVLRFQADATDTVRLSDGAIIAVINGCILCFPGNMPWPERVFIRRLEIFGIHLYENDTTLGGNMRTLTNFTGEIVYGPAVARDDWISRLRSKYSEL